MINSLLNICLKALSEAIEIHWDIFHKTIQLLPAEVRQSLFENYLQTEDISSDFSLELFKIGFFDGFSQFILTNSSISDKGIPNSFKNRFSFNAISFKCPGVTEECKLT